MYVHDILTKQQFKDSIAIFAATRSNRIVQIGRELATYHQLQKWDVEQRLAQLKVIHDWCVSFITKADSLSAVHWHRKQRKTGVEILLSQTDAKADYLQKVLDIEHQRRDLLIIPLNQLSDLEKANRAQLAQAFIGDPANGKILNHRYWGEVVDPLHRPLNKDKNEQLFRVWLDERYGPNPTTNLSFYRWLEMQDVAGMVYSQYQGINDREKYRVFPVNHELSADINGNVLASTTANSSNFSGKGWAIFVLSMNGMLYKGTHDNSEHGFFHSCFLAGAKVAAAGEIKIRNGRMEAVSPKSGHYQPGADEMVRILTWIQNVHPLGGCRVQWFVREANGALRILGNMGGGIVKIEWYDAAQFLAANGDVTNINPLRTEAAGQNSLTSRIVHDPNRGADSDNLAHYVSTPCPGWVDWLT